MFEDEHWGIRHGLRSRDDLDHPILYFSMDLSTGHRTEYSSFFESRKETDLKTGTGNKNLCRLTHNRDVLVGKNVTILVEVSWRLTDWMQFIFFPTVVSASTRRSRLLRPFFLSWASLYFPPYYFIEFRSRPVTDRSSHWKRQVIVKKV